MFRVIIKKMVTLLLVSMLILTVVSCSGETVASNTVSVSQPVSESAEESTTAVEVKQYAGTTPSVVSVDYDNDDLNTSSSDSGISDILLAGNSITFNGSGATVNGTTITIVSSGTYNVHGTLNDGQIVIDTQNQETVRLVLNGVDITNSTSAPIYVISADKTVIELADGTENYITDGETYVFESEESDEPNAAIFSKDDLTINGNGSLIVNANYNNGITSKDDLKIAGGNITVNAVNDGIKGKDSIAIKDGVIIVDAGSDGLQSYNDSDAEKGYISIEGGSLNITAVGDGIQAETSLIISGGNLTITSGGGSSNGPQHSQDNWGRQNNQDNWDWDTNTDGSDTTTSSKGLKAGVALQISGGTLNIDSADDTLHSDNILAIDGGQLTLASGDDGIHSETTLEINAGDIDITTSYEGIESAVITINNGTIHLIASDDGINASSGSTGDARGGGQRPGPGGFGESSNNYLYVNGGYVSVNASGDGLDVNGSIQMTGGAVIVSGPTNNGNGALDYYGTMDITGGLLVAAGSSGMAQAPSTSSTQYSVLLNLSSPQAAGTIIHIETDGGKEILTFAPAKEYQSVVLSSPELENGATYNVYTGGSSTGTATDGIYSGGTYSSGAQTTSFTISEIVTGGGFGGGMGGMGGGGRRGGGMGGPGSNNTGTTDAPNSNMPPGAPGGNMQPGAPGGNIQPSTGG